MSITAERGQYTCDGCGEKLPFSSFRDGGRADSVTGDWFCVKCNRCPQCGQGQRGHDCKLPGLLEAIGADVELTPRELSIVKWLAGWDFDCVETLAGIFRKLRAKGE